MKFLKDFLLNKLDEGHEESGILGTRRWCVDHWAVFEHEGKFYRTIYSTAATEQQDESPYEYEDDEIECEEVQKIPVMKHIWEAVE